MEKEQKLNWCFTCEFSIFAQAYTGLQDSEEIMALIEEQDQIHFVNTQKESEFLTETDLMGIWHDFVEIRPYAIMENNGITILSLAVYHENDAIELECDCVEPEELLGEIIKLIYK